MMDEDDGFEVETEHEECDEYYFDRIEAEWLAQEREKRAKENP